jgi:hypothetical protein
MDKKMDESNNDLYLHESASCPACGCSGSHTHRGWDIATVVILIVLLILLGFIYIRYLLTSQESRTCMAAMASSKGGTETDSPRSVSAATTSSSSKAKLRGRDFTRSVLNI